MVMEKSWGKMLSSLDISVEKRVSPPTPIENQLKDSPLLILQLKYSFSILSTKPGYKEIHTEDAIP